MATQLNIIQWNAQSAKAKRANLERLITDYNADIILICETWDDREDGHGGTAIFVNKVINAKPLSFTSRPKNVNISGIYLPQITDMAVQPFLSTRPVHAPMSCQDYNGLLNQIKTPFILGGDFNAHHSAMGSSKTDNDGNLLLKTIDNHQLVFLNDGSPTKLSRPNQCVSAIDVSLVSSSID
ncbi:Endonuclease-reverse transcriptase [Popillia japonica]|uniref:Endonuclease-reverse transcriptase n=1 Tax=Popillia japonica TaxID=7064 RepID=A0AAW1MF86_POPJA